MQPVHVTHARTASPHDLDAVSHVACICRARPAPRWSLRDILVQHRTLPPPPPGQVTRPKSRVSGERRRAEMSLSNSMPPLAANASGPDPASAAKAQSRDVLVQQRDPPTPLPGQAQSQRRKAQSRDVLVQQRFLPPPPQGQARRRQRERQELRTKRMKGQELPQWWTAG